MNRKKIKTKQKPNAIQLKIALIITFQSYRSTFIIHSTTISHECQLDWRRSALCLERIGSIHLLTSIFRSLNKRILSFAWEKVFTKRFSMFCGRYCLLILHRGIQNFSEGAILPIVQKLLILISISKSKPKVVRLVRVSNFSNKNATKPKILMCTSNRYGIRRHMHSIACIFNILLLVVLDYLTHDTCVCAWVLSLNLDTHVVLFSQKNQNRDMVEHATDAVFFFVSSFLGFKLSEMCGAAWISIVKVTHWMLLSVFPCKKRKKLTYFFNNTITLVVRHAIWLLKTIRQKLDWINLNVTEIK